MKPLKITLLTLAVSASLSSSLAYAAYDNPFIDTSSSPNQTNSTSSNPASTLPQNQAASPSNPQSAPTPPNYNFAKPNPSMIKPWPGLSPNSAQTQQTANSSNPAIMPTPNTPNLGPGGTQQQANSNSLMQAIMTLDNDVKNTNKINLSAWNQTIQNQAQANAMLLPTNLNFLWGQSAYQNIQQLSVASVNQYNSMNVMFQQKASNIGNCQNDNLLGGMTSNCSNTSISSSVPSPIILMNSQAYNSKNKSNNSNEVAGNYYITSLTGAAQSEASYKQNSNQLAVLSAAKYVLSNIGSNNTPDNQDQLDSPMSILNTAVMAPLSTTPDPVSGQTWFQQLSVASTPQLLRSVAIMLALNNYLQYQNLKAAQNQQLLQAAQLVEMVRLEQSMDNLNSSDDKRLNNALLQIKGMLQKNQ